MNILYIHGFGSVADSNSSKCRELKRLGNVFAYAPDYSKDLKGLMAEIIEVIYLEKVNLIVGTSMGGWFASILSYEYKIPFIAINPALKPSQTLLKYEGKDVSRSGYSEIMTKRAIRTLINFIPSKLGMILLDADDELFSSYATKQILEDHMPVHMFMGGSHRFDHMNGAVQIIETFYENLRPNDGLTND